MQEQINTIRLWLGTGAINVFGLPFAGKDTQGAKLAEMFNGVMISSGDILRQNKDNQKLQEIMASGQIIPSELFESIVVPYLGNPDIAEKALILSEVGRMDGEQQVIVKATDQTGHSQKAVVLLNLSDEEVWKRFDASQSTGDRGARQDDNKAVLQTRLDSYHQKVTPVLDYYKQQGLLVDVDGSLSREQVTQEILIGLLEKAQA